MSRPAATVRLMIVLGCLGAFAPLAVDMYLPAWPAIEDELRSSASAVQLTLTTFLLGICAGQLVAGPLSDKVGRRMPLLVSVAAFVIACAACAIAPSIVVLAALRFVQGFTGGAGIAIGRAIVRDLASGDDAARSYSLLFFVNNIGPIVAPILGGQLLHVTDWRGIFGVLAALALVLLVVCFRAIPESLAPGARTEGGLRAMSAALREVSRDRVFLGYAISSGLTFSALLAYLAGSSFVLQDIYGYSPQAFSLIFALNGIGLVLVTWLNGRLIGRVTPRALLLAGMVITSLGAALLGVSVAAGDPPAAAVIVAFLLIVSSIGLVQPNSTTLAMAPHPHVAGSASGLLGVMQSSVGALVAPLVGIAGPDSIVPLAIITVALVVGAWLALLLTRNAPAAPVEVEIDPEPSAV